MRQLLNRMLRIGSDIDYPKPVTRIFSNAWREPRRWHSRTIQSPTVVFALDWSAPPQAWLSGWPLLKRLESICSCSSAVPNTRRWNDLLRPSFSPAPQLQNLWKQERLPSEVKRKTRKAYPYLREKLHEHQFVVTLVVNQIVN